MGRLPRWTAVAALTVVAALGVPLSPLAAQQSDSELHTFRTEGGPDERVTLVATTPPAVIGAALPPTAFTVLQGGAPVPAEVVPYGTEGLEIALVLGARSSSSLNAEQESGAEFVRFLAGNARIAVVDASGPRTLVPMTTDGDRVVKGMLDVENASTSEPTNEAAVEAALEEFSDEARRRAVVLMTDDLGEVSDGLAGRLVEAGASLHYIQAAVDAEPVPSLVEAADASGGRAQQGDLRGLIRTVDQVRADLDNQYRIRFQATGALPVQVRVVTAGGELTDTVDLTTPPATVPPPAEEEAAAAPSEPAQATEAAEDDGGDSSSTLIVAAIVVLLLLTGALVVAALVLRRRQAPLPPRPPSAVVVDLRDQPTSPADDPRETTAPGAES